MGRKRILDSTEAPPLSRRQLEIVKYVLVPRAAAPQAMSSSEGSKAIMNFFLAWMMSSKTARTLAQDFLSTAALSASTSAHAGHNPANASACGINGCDMVKPPTAMGLHRRLAHGVEGLAQRRRKLPGRGHVIRVTMHAAIRLKELFGLSDLVEASDAADVLWLEAKDGTPYPARDGAVFYEHPEALLLVGAEREPAELISVMPPSWTLLKDVQGRGHYWAVGPEERRKGDPATTN